MSEFIPGTIINQRFLAINALGSGGFGDVYFCFDLKKQVHVALKVNKIPLEVNANVNEYLHQKDLKHPNLVKILEYVGKNKKWEHECLVFEYVQGESLLDAIENRSLGEIDKLKIIARLADCLNYLHENKIIHNDIKPGNIILTFDKVPKLIDFGISYEDQKNHRYELTTTHAYGDPRIFRGEIKTPDRQSDIYSFGLTIWQIYKNLLPFYNRQFIERSNIKNMDELIEHIFYKCTHPDLKIRYSNIGQLMNDLARWKEIKKKELDKNINEIQDVFKLGHYEDFFLMAIDLRQALNQVSKTKIKSNRIDGLFVDEDEKYDFSNDVAYITFDYEGMQFGINGDTKLDAIETLVSQLEQSISYSLMQPETVLHIDDAKDGERTKLRLKCNYDVMDKRYRANGFYCYSPVVEATI